MAFRLTNRESSLRDEYVHRLRKAHEDVTAAMVDFNEKLDKLTGDVNQAVARYNEVQADAQEFISNITARLEEEVNDKSEKWQESDRGQAASTFLDEWNIELDPMADLELPPVDDPFVDTGADELENLPTEAEV